MGDIVDFRRKSELNSEEFEDPMEKEEFVINTHSTPAELAVALDELWCNLYIRRKISDMYADDDGKIGYTAKWVNPIEVEPDYDRSLKESLRIASDFINNNALSTKFMEYYDEEVDKRDVLKLLVIGTNEVKHEK